MNRGQFRKEVRQGLEKLNREQTVHFAWRCAVRALPFLGHNGNFNFWNKKDRQRHIYSILYALDFNTPDTNSAANNVNAANNSASFASSATDAICAVSAYADTVYAYAYVSDTYTDAEIANTYASAYAADAATAAANAYFAVSNSVNVTMNLEFIILQDLNTIQSNSGGEDQYKPSYLYGRVWYDFLKALDAEGCAYWGQLYKDIFDSGLVLDLKALEIRKNVPKEKQAEGAAAVANYLEKLEKGATRLNEARIIILGDKGAGKTSIARRLINPTAPMPTDKESTAGVDMSLWKLEHENINIRIWDFAGHTVTHTVHQFFLSERCLYIMVYNGRTEERDRLEYWLNHMENYGGDSQAFILVNKYDQHSVEIPINFLKEQYPIAGVYTFSIQDDKTELIDFRNKVADYIKNNPSWEHQLIPISYYRVKDELESLFERGDKEEGREHIRRDEFEEIAEKYDVENVEELLKDLHSLGVSLWYKDIKEFDTLVLNPEWISHGVYKIINWANNAKRYSLSLHDFASVFEQDGNRYPEEKHKFLFELMRHYELAYKAESGDLIIPRLLQEDRPEELPDFPIGSSLMLRYSAEQPLLPNTVSRLIVRHHQEIKRKRNNDLVWRYGVVLEDGIGSTALVREEDRTISVSVKGRDKTNYISDLRATLNDIFDSYKSKKPALQYRVERFGQLPDEADDRNPLWLPDSKIINHYKREKPYYDDYTDQDIPMGGVVNNYNITTENLMLEGRENQFIADKSIHTTFNFHNCNIGLQGNLNELSQLLTEGGNKQEAKELESAAKALEQVENSKSKEEVKKKGIVNRLKRLLDDLNNRESGLHKTVKGIKNGVSIAQDIAKGYNDTAQWLGLPQVPTPFLK